MIELTVLNYLNSNLTGVPVYTQMPPDPPDEFVIIEKTGSGKENYILSATFALQSYAPSLFRAAEINEMVKNLMDNIIVLDKVAKSSLNSDYNFTDPETKIPRYQAVYDLIHY